MDEPQSPESSLPSSKPPFAGPSATPPPPIPPVPPRYPVAPPPVPVKPPGRRSNLGWWIAIGLIGIGLFLLVAALSLGSFFKGLVPTSSSYASHHGAHFIESVIEEGDSDERILVIPVEGIISSAALDHVGQSMVQLLKHQLEKAAKDESIKAVILKVDSPGGEVLASDDMYALLKKFQEEHHKPVIAAMGNLAASGGYYVSAPCQWIVANPLTITGSIGVIMHGMNYRGLMDKVGIRPEVFKSGKFKDMLSGDKREEDILPEERAMVQKMVNETFDRFKEVVAEGRQRANQANGKGTPEKSHGRTLTGKWADYADGRILSGKEAHELGFVDELGDFETAVKRATTIAKLTNPELIELQPQFDLSNLFRMFGESRSSRIKVDIGIPAPQLRPGCLYYLWSAAVPQG